MIQPSLIDYLFFIYLRRSTEKYSITNDNRPTSNWQPPATVRALVFTFFTDLSLEGKN